MFDPADLPPRLADKIVLPAATECWLWVSSLNRYGYGQISWGGKPKGAHRVVYELLKGPIARHHEIDHLCRVPNCVNPAHLEAVAPIENQNRGRRDRGEPPAMHKIGFLVDVELRASLEQFHKDSGLSKGEAYRRLLRFALDHI